MVSDTLKFYRSLQRRIALYRDGGLCVFHYFGMHGPSRRIRGEEVHHMFGRSRQVSSPVENYTHLVTTCRECHPQPIVLQGRDEHADIIACWLKANLYPIERTFTHAAKYDKYLRNVLTNSDWLKYLE